MLERVRAHRQTFFHIRGPHGPRLRFSERRIHLVQEEDSLDSLFRFLPIQLFSPPCCLKKKTKNQYKAKALCHQGRGTAPSSTSAGSFRSPCWELPIHIRWVLGATHFVGAGLCQPPEVESERERDCPHSFGWSSAGLCTHTGQPEDHPQATSRQLLGNRLTPSVMDVLCTAEMNSTRTSLCSPSQHSSEGGSWCPGFGEVPTLVIKMTQAPTLMSLPPLPFFLSHQDDLTVSFPGVQFKIVRLTSTLLHWQRCGQHTFVSITG